MDPTKRIIINTTAQYIKAVINIVLSLYSTRLILEALNVSDFGIYSVIGGVVAMLGFVTNALAITTQRYLSHNYGQGNYNEVKKVFANSLFLNYSIALSITIILLLLRPWLIYHVLNIPPARIGAAKIVFLFTIYILAITIVTSAYKALFIAHENIVYVSIVDVLDGILKFSLALCLFHVTADKLVVYSIMMASIFTFNFLAYVIYSNFRFKEACIIVKLKSLNKQCIRRLAGFTGWTTYGMGAIACRNQGIAIVLNIFYGTAINASYGIANQVYSAVSFISTSILNAMNPQIMKSEGKGDIKTMLDMACRESKFSVMIMSLVSVPLITEMPQILSFWLSHYPEQTTMFCRFILLGFILDQLTIGLNVANQAMGKIKIYSIITYTPKLLSLLIFYLILKNGGSVFEVMLTYFAVETLVSLIRIPYIHATIGLSAKEYCKKVIIPLMPLFLALSITSNTIANCFEFHFRFVVTVASSVIVGIMTIWFMALNGEEKEFVRANIGKLISRLK